MNNETAALKKRQTWCDIIRGICSLSVILIHIPDIPGGILMYVTPFTLPCFFYFRVILPKMTEEIFPYSFTIKCSKKSY